MHKYHRLTLLLLALVLAFSLVGCGTASNSAQNSSEKKIEKTEKKAKQEKKDKSKKEADQTGSASAGTDTTNQQLAASSDKASSPANNQTTNKVVSSQPATNNTQGQPTQPKTTTPAANTTAPAVTTPAPSPKVTISIIGPKDHSSILGATKVDIKEGDTVMDVLIKAVGNNKVASSGSGATAYVEGIDNVYELDYGPQSGWTYKLNGAMIQQSAGAVKVKDGDQIVWTYKEG